MPDRLSFRAVVALDPARPVEVRTVEGEFGAASDVLVRIDATSVCHTDYEAVTGRLGFGFPFVPGHEAAGTVEAVGAGVASVRRGDTVILSWNPSCGTCFYCARSLPILCEPYVRGSAEGTLLDGRSRLALDGRGIRHMAFLSSFAQYAVVTEESAIPVPAGMPADRACMIGCAVATGYGAAVRVAGVSAGETALVIGCGAVGLSAIQGARHAGARVLAADLDPRKRALALGMGAEAAIDPRAHATADAVRELTAGRGADCVIECAGTEQAFRDSVEAARPGARVVWLGKLPANDRASFRWGSLMGEKRIVRSSYGGTRAAEDFPRLAQLYLDGKLALDPLLERSGTLAAAPEFLAAVGDGTALRNVIRPHA